MDFKDYYEALGIDRKASADEIQRAYKKLARKYHPDINKEPGAEDRFKDIGEAYEVLKDPEKRAKYDRFGQAWKQARQRSGGVPPGWEKVRVEYGPGFESDFGGTGGEDFASLLEQLFGGRGGFGGPGFGARGGFGGFRPGGARGGGGQWAQPGGSVEAEIELTLEEAARGGTRTITLQDPATGERDTVQVTVPQGIRPGQRLRLAGKGGAGTGGAPAGDLLLKVSVVPHPRFRLEERDLHTRVEVAPWTAALGGEAEVPTLDGALRIKVPAGTSSGRRIRLRGKGFPAGGEAGDLIAEISVAVPETLNERERELFEELARVSEFRPGGAAGA
ncbi:MAG TPA: DnaJ C-terminal domain-containing protein [Thermoanaerobaculia bacterium]|nr:DnaJ C-terminal domain-containing protein [Thermoanaerobaculia bacterium]